MDTEQVGFFYSYMHHLIESYLIAPNAVVLAWKPPWESTNFCETLYDICFHFLYLIYYLTLFRRQCTLQAPKLEPIPGGSASAQLITSDYASVSYSASPYSNEDLRAAVYEYFSASNRIAMGERYRIRGRRVLTNGQVEWLIEWKSCIT